MKVDPRLLFQRLKQDEILWKDIESDDEPNKALYPTNTKGNKTRVYLYYAQAAHKVIEVAKSLTADDKESFPNIFSGPIDPEFSLVYADGLFEAEDLFRALCFLSLVLTKTSKKKGIEEEPSSRSLIYKGVLVLPLFHTVREGYVNTQQQNAANARAFASILKAGGSAIDSSGDQLLKEFAAGALIDKKESADTADRIPGFGKPSVRSDVP